ncbi:LysE family transporter [Campylobacter sputorum]|uniref:LysE family transporter n=1 Tax=Campylobacter sputorum TaxID=206 RepID=UPI000A7A7470|nr:LysE family transporter [Campylobacter sputorum]
MINFLLQGILLGYGAAVPIGPVNIIIMSYALKSYTYALLFGIGAMCADIFYLILLNYGILNFLNTPIILKSLAIFGAIFLLYISYTIIKNAHNKISFKDVEFSSKLQTFLKGFLLTISNPYTIGFWLSIATISSDKSSSIAIICGLIIAIFSWISLMPLFVYKNRNFINNHMARNLSYIASIILLFFAFMLIYKNFII